eukprot:Pgem_evm1s12972
MSCFFAYTMPQDGCVDSYCLKCNKLISPGEEFVLDLVRFRTYCCDQRCTMDGDEEIDQHLERLLQSQNSILQQHRQHQKGAKVMQLIKHMKNNTAPQELHNMQHKQLHLHQQNGYPSSPRSPRHDKKGKTRRTYIAEEQL